MLKEGVEATQDAIIMENRVAEDNRWRGTTNLTSLSYQTILKGPAVSLAHSTSQLKHAL